MIRRLSREDGFTMVEVLTAMVVGLVVLAAAFDLVSRSTSLLTTTQDRVEASQRGRFTMENIVTELRSGVCVTPDVGDPMPPVIKGESNRVEFYANNRTDSAAPQRRVLSYDAGRHAIVEETYDALWTDANNPGKIKTPVALNPKSRTLLTNVYPRDNGAPIFRYFAYEVAQTGTDPDGTPLYAVTGLADPSLDPSSATRGTSQMPGAQLPIPANGIVARDDLLKIIAVSVAFRVRPASDKSTQNDPRDAILAGTAFARTADPTLAVDAQKVATAVQPDGSQKKVGQGIQCS